MFNYTMTIHDMRIELSKYCDGFYNCSDGCRLRKPDGNCAWDKRGDESTIDCYWFLIAKGLIVKPEQPKINFVKVERNDEVKPTNDAVNHPSHYTYGGIECIDVIKAVVNEIPNGICAWLTGQVIKYIWRWTRKDKPVEDLKKCRFYLDRLIENAEVVYGKNTVR